MTRRTSDNSNAIDAFLAAKAEIDAMLERLAAHLAQKRNHPLTHRRYYKKIAY